MSAAKKTIFSLPDADSADVCRRLGLAISNAAMYGMEHAVTATSQSKVYDVLVGLLDCFGELEWSFCEDGLLLNGKPVDVSKGTGQVLVDQMRRKNVHNIAFCDPLDRREFAQFLKVLTSEKGAGQPADGIAEAVMKCGFQSIRVDNATYERIGKIPAAQEIRAAVNPVELKEKRNSTAGRVFDLDSDEFSMPSDTGMDMMASAFSESFDMTAQVARYVEHCSEMRQQQTEMVDLVKRCAGDALSIESLREQLLATGLSATEWDMLLLESGAGGAAGRADATLGRLLRDVEKLAVDRATSGVDAQAMEHALKSIGREVDDLIRHTRGQATTLAQRVDADRSTVAELERTARASGVGLQLSREELLANLAEINQELVQPLTASMALVQLLASGKVGSMPREQRDILTMASEGMERLEKLISFLQRVSGFPIELAPDKALLSEVYNR